jgi:hypothetical protein
MTMTDRALLLVASLFVLCTIVLSQMQGGGIVDAANTIRDVDFNSPLNNTYDLGKPLLVEYHNTTWGVYETRAGLSL